MIDGRRLELLSPAGDMEKLWAAARFGADAVYVGGPKLQLRAGATGFSLEAVAEAAEYLHGLGKRLYVAANAFMNNDEVASAGDYARHLRDAGADALIISDLGAIAAVREAVPEIEVHVSTQANCLNDRAARVYHDMGASRVVLGREMTLDEIVRLRDRTPPELELEAFVHGAMCMAYSGRCMISAYLTGRSANRGGCAQSCRWRYSLMEETRPGEYFPVSEDGNGTAILSSCDLNCLSFMDRLMDAGVTSFKIEGRMKSAFYVATVTGTYRRRIDAITSGTADDEQLMLLQRELNAVSHREYASGFYFGEMKRHAPDAGVYMQDCAFVGTVLERLPGGRVRVEQRNRVRAGDVIEVVSPNALGLRFTAGHMTDADGQAIDVAAVPMMQFDMDAPDTVAAGDMLRIRQKA